MAIYSSDLPYFKTSKSSADKWIERTIKIINNSGGKIIKEASGTDYQTGRAAFLLIFRMSGDTYKISFPVMPVKRPENERAAKVQAATILFHDIKARLISAKVLGARAVFFGYLLLQDGRTPSELENPNILSADNLFRLSPGNDEVIEGELINE